MNQLDEIYDNERIEKDTFRSMRELSKYTKILSKDNNLFVIIKKKLCQIKLLSSKSLFKISLLLDILPEENVSFTFYTEEKDEQKDFNKISINNNIDNKKEKNTEKNKGIFIIDNIDNKIANEIYNKEKGNIIGYNYYFFKSLWKYLYLFCLITSLISFCLICAYSINTLLKKEYYLFGSNIFTLISLCLIILASYSGYKKLSNKKRISFKNENILLICFIPLSIFCGIIWIYIFNKYETELNLNIILIIEIILGVLDIVSGVLIYLNIKMVDFYEEYSKLSDEGTPLVEI